MRHRPTDPVLARLMRAGPLLAALGLAAAAAVPLLADPGFLMTRSGGDSPFLLLRLHQLVEALRGGQFPARWMPDAAYGYGYPFFSYYAALPYYLAALLHFYGFSFNLSLKLTQLAALLLAAAGCYAWARGLPGGARAGGLSRPAALLASAAYTFAPFHLVNLYVRGDSLSELWAMSFYPLILWRGQRLIERPAFGRALAFAALIAALTLTHNISALIFMPVAALYLLLAGASRALAARKAEPRRSAWRPLLAGGLALAWGLALAAFFWVPALGETAYTQISDVTQGYFFYGNHFRSADLVQPSLFFSHDTQPGAPTPFSMGLAQALAAAAGLAVLAWRAARRRAWGYGDTFVVIGLTVSTLMMTPLSAWAWENLPLLAFAQFPWRFLSIQALFAAAATGYVIGRRSDAGHGLGRWLAAVALSVALGVFGLGRLAPDFVPLNDADVTAERLQWMEAFTANIGSTIGYEYLPRAVMPRPFVSDSVLGRPPRLKVLQGSAQGAQVWRRGAAEQWAIEVTGGPARVAVPTYYWPGWSARVNDQPAPVSAAHNLGWIALDLPPGAHSVTLRLGSTPLRTAAEAGSLLALAVPLAAAAAQRARNWRWPHTLRWRAALPLAAAALLATAGALALRAVPPAASSLPLSLDFDQLAMPHHDIIRFEGGTQLRAVVFSSQRLARGQALIIETKWQAAEPGLVTLSLTPASDLLNPLPEAVSADRQTLNAAGAAALMHELETPGDLAPGLYWVTATLTEPGGARPALTSAGRPRGRLHLAPVRVEAGAALAPAEPYLADLGSSIRLLSAAGRSIDGGVEINLLWQALADPPISAQAALRVRDAAGFEWAASDYQAGYGFYPTQLWRAGEAVPDTYRLSLSAGAPPGDYTVSLHLYDPAAPEGQGSLGSLEFGVALAGATPAGARPTAHALLPALGLAEVAFPARFDQGDAPEIRAGWLTGSAPGQDYRAEWRLTPREAGESVTHVLELAPGSSSRDWPANAYILGRARLGTWAGLPPGVYDLSVTLVDESGQAVGQTAVVAQTEVIGRARSFDLPPLQAQVGATFGDVVALWGYNAEMDAEQLRLSLTWGALKTPAADYKYFVHLLNPADGFVLAQVDAVPRDFTYPTALWVEGEVVVDTVTFALADLPPGTYRLAVGWYNPNTPGLDRLPARDAQGQPLADDRVLLPLEVVRP